MKFHVTFNANEDTIVRSLIVPCIHTNSSLKKRNHIQCKTMHMLYQNFFVGFVLVRRQTKHQPPCKVWMSFLSRTHLPANCNTTSVSTNIRNTTGRNYSLRNLLQLLTAVATALELLQPKWCLPRNIQVVCSFRPFPFVPVEADGHTCAQGFATCVNHMCGVEVLIHIPEGFALRLKTNSSKSQRRWCSAQKVL